MRQVIHFTIGVFVAFTFVLVTNVWWNDSDTAAMWFGLSAGVLGALVVTLLEGHLWGWVKDKLGLKPYLRSCPNGEHWWRAVWGDERNVVKARYICENCPKKTNTLPEDALVVESDSEFWIRQYLRNHP